MQNISIPQLLIVMVIVLLIFGPKKLPGLGKAIGQSIREFRDGMKNINSTLNEDESESAKPVAPARPVSTSDASQDKTDGEKPAQTP